MGYYFYCELEEKMRCPALYWNGKRYCCALADISKAARRSLQIGAGCTSSLNSWREDVKERE